MVSKAKIKILQGILENLKERGYTPLSKLNNISLHSTINTAILHEKVKDHVCL